MNIEQLREYCLSIKEATESFPFGSFSNKGNDILVFKIMDKMFAYIDIFPTRNLEKNWNSIELDADIPDRIIKELISQSVQEVVKTLSKKKQEEYRCLEIKK